MDSQDLGDVHASLAICLVKPLVGVLTGQQVLIKSIL